MNPIKKKWLSIIMILAGLGLLAGFIVKFNVAVEPQESGSDNGLENQDQEIVDYQASFLIYTNGTRRVFSSPMYHNLSQDVYIEAADPRVVHVTKSGVTWNEFFSTLPMELTAECLVTGTGERFCNTEARTLKFYINGERAVDFLDRIINDDDWVLISYGVDDQRQIDTQMEASRSIL